MNNKFLISTLLTLLSGCATNNTSPDLTAGIGHGAATAIQSSVSKKASEAPVVSQSSKASANSSQKEYFPLTTQPGLYVLSEEKTSKLTNLYPEPEKEVFSPAVPLKGDSNSKNSDIPASSVGNSSRYKVSGEKTANGESYNTRSMTATHKRLPIPSHLKETHLSNKRSEVLRVNEHGSFYANRVIDLSEQTAKKLETHQPDTEMIKVEAIPPHHKDRVYLQLGVFSNPENAQQLKRKIVKNQMPEPVVKEIRMEGKPAYRVQLGPLFSTAKVNEFNAKLAKIGITETWHVTENKL